MSADASAVDTGATAPRPRAVVFAVMPGGHGAPGEEEPLNEIKELLSSADMDWVADVLQRKERPHPHSYLGKGKLVELAEAVKESGATVAVCEDDLSPGQVAAVLDAVDVDVLDRTELILTVFSKHAHSMEGTMQVHLAQLEYELTRMRGKGHILSRLGAGVNMRGPGETKLEVDRRVVRQRIQTLRRRIDHMARTRRTQRARRLNAAVPLIALAGYTNAGKSTLLNALTDADVSVRDRLFETLDPTSRSYRFRDRDYVLTDTVGFIRKLPHSLVDAFASTLEETTLADVILVVADAHLEPSEIEAREQTVAEVLDMLGAQAPRIARLQQDRPRRSRQADAPAGALPGGRVHRRGPRRGPRPAAGAPGRLLRPRPAAGAAALPLRRRRRHAPPARHRQRRPRGAHARRRGLHRPAARGGSRALRALQPRRHGVDRGPVGRRPASRTPPRDGRRRGESAMSSEPADRALDGPGGVTVPVKLLGAAARLPARAYEHDAAYDLHAAEDVVIEPLGRAVVGTGVALGLPPGLAALTLPRSGLAARHGISIVNAPGLIDPGYRGEVRVILLNTDRDERVSRGCRRSHRAAAVPVADQGGSGGRPTSSTRRSEALGASVPVEEGRGHDRGRHPRPGPGRRRLRRTSLLFV